MIDPATAADSGRRISGTQLPATGTPSACSMTSSYYRAGSATGEPDARSAIRRATRRESSRKPDRPNLRRHQLHTQCGRFGGDREAGESPGCRPDVFEKARVWLTRSGKAVGPRREVLQGATRQLVDRIPLCDAREHRFHPWVLAADKDKGYEQAWATARSRLRAVRDATAEQRHPSSGQQDATLASGTARSGLTQHLNAHHMANV